MRKACPIAAIINGGQKGRGVNGGRTVVAVIEVESVAALRGEGRDKRIAAACRVSKIVPKRGSAIAVIEATDQRKAKLVAGNRRKKRVDRGSRDVEIAIEVKPRDDR